MEKIIRVSQVFQLLHVPAMKLECVEAGVGVCVCCRSTSCDGGQQARHSVPFTDICTLMLKYSEAGVAGVLVVDGGSCFPACQVVM